MSWDKQQVIFTDCETTGLDVFRHDAWEIAWIEWDNLLDRWVEETRRIFPPALQDADTVALAINQFYRRTQPVHSADFVEWNDPRYVAEEIAYHFAGKHIIGACPWFDASFYQKLLLQNGFQVSWHYHMIDVEAAGIGYLAGRLERERGEFLELPLPWKSDWLAEALDLKRPDKTERHTAIGDAREVKNTFYRIFGDPDEPESVG